MSKFRNIATVGLSAAFIFGFSIWSIAKPATDMSQSERRKLTQFPELTLETVTDGSFSGFATRVIKSPVSTATESDNKILILLPSFHRY